MKLLKKILIAALIAVLCFYMFKKYQPSIKAVYPKQCSFLIDKQFSLAYQKTLQNFVSQKYEFCKDFKQILDDVSEQFFEIESMDAYVCKTDHLCFSFDAAKPLFLLNDHVVCRNKYVASKDHFNQDVVDGLVAIESKNVPEIERVISFAEKVSLSVFQEFDLLWNNDYEIALTVKNKKSDILLFSVKNLPTLDAIALFKTVKQQKKSNKKQIYDFRFNNQLIVK